MASSVRWIVCFPVLKVTHFEDRISSRKNFSWRAWSGASIGAPLVFDYMFPLMRDRLDGVLTVSEESMMEAMHHLAKETHAVAGAAGAAGLVAARTFAAKLEPPVVS